MQRTLERKSLATINGTEIDLSPTAGMKEEAQRYRDWKADGEAGGTEVAARRATQILSGDELSADTVITMAAWFARHLSDKQGEGFRLERMATHLMAVWLGLRGAETLGRCGLLTRRIELKKSANVLCPTNRK